ncbi:restriction endonuclease subunit S [Enterococcus faecalis]|nr:restriction endonuclease subunit S [Enterococcus faecalis]MCA6711930.1 restriction endonuclease subunit S [Enterococcus faecalis]MCA6730909.1 restriction endonuclease subunit S [Enterococcus faecalis]
MKKVPRLRFRGFSEDWELCKLGEESDVRDGTHDSPKYFDDGYPLVTSKNLKDFGLDLSDVSLISYKDFKSINKRSKVDIGDILFGMIGTIGNPVQIFRDDFAIKNVALIKEQRKILNGFLIHILKSPVFDRYIRNENAGGTQKFLALSKVRGFEFLRPNIEEQVRIGNLFKQIDNTITLHQRKLEQLKELKKAYLQLMFPKKDEIVPRMRFADFEGEWEQCKLKNLFLKGGSGGTPTSSNSDYYNGDIPFLSISDITKSNGYIYTTEKCISLEGLKNSSAWIVPKESISLAMYASVGKVAILKLDIATSQAFYNMIFEDINTRNYIYHYLIKKEVFNEWITLISTGTQANLNADKVKNTFVLIPSNNEQKKIAELLRCIEVSIDIQQEKIHILKSLKKSYLQNMFI